MSAGRPHLLGVDDGPFDKWSDAEVPLVAVAMEGADLVEAVATTRFGVDGEGVTPFLAEWIGGLRVRPALRGVLLGGITIAGLAVVDVRALASAIDLPVIVVNRRDPAEHRLHHALRAAGLESRLPVVDATPPAFPVNDRLWAACAGIERAGACELVEAARRKGELPEPLRLAHLIARAMVSGESRGRA